MGLEYSEKSKYYSYKLSSYIIIEIRVYKRELQDTMEPTMKDLKSDQGWVP